MLPSHDCFPQKLSAVPELHTNKALCNLKLGNWSQVVKNCDEAIRLNPSTIKAYFLKGCALTELGNFDPAIVCLKTGLHFISSA